MKLGILFLFLPLSVFAATEDQLQKERAAGVQCLANLHKKGLSLKANGTRMLPLDLSHDEAYLFEESQKSPPDKPSRFLTKYIVLPDGRACATEFGIPVRQNANLIEMQVDKQPLFCVEYRRHKEIDYKVGDATRNDIPQETQVLAGSCPTSKDMHIGQITVETAKKQICNKIHLFLPAKFTEMMIRIVEEIPPAQLTAVSPALRDCQKNADLHKDVREKINEVLGKNAPAPKSGTGPGAT